MFLCFAHWFQKSMFLSYSGDARLSRSVKNKVYSFDLVSNDPSVIACDMSHVCAKLFSCFRSAFVDVIRREIN